MTDYEAMFMLALEAVELGPNHPWRHVYLMLLEETVEANE